MSDEAKKSQALVVVEQPRTHGAIVLRESLREATEQRSVLREYVQNHMSEGTDFGKIPGTPKPTLLKPGAEKLVDLFRCTPKFAIITRTEDFEKGFFNYIFRCRLYSRDAEAVLAEGFGSANSREGRYRWRTAAQKCPKCGKETIIESKPEYGGGWVCFKKKGGCGAKFSPSASEIASQPQGKVENDDIATMANTILKMAKKRALVDAAIALARCSDLFTQDVEDTMGVGEPPPMGEPPPDDVPPPEEWTAAPPPPVQRAQPVQQRGGAPDPVDVFLAELAQVDSTAAVDAMSKQVLKVVPTGHPRRPEVGQALNAARNRVKGAR